MNLAQRIQELEQQCAAMRHAIALALTDSSNPLVPLILEAALWGKESRAQTEHKENGAAETERSD